jgi:DNA repair protein RecO (recombination protein O)
VLTRTEGIVLKTHKYGDADLIVTYLTSDRGLVKAFAKSPRKTKSRFGSSLEPLTHARLSLMGKEQSLPKITQSDIVNSFHTVRENYGDFINVSRLIEIIISVTPEGHPNRKLFSFFLNTLQLIKSSDPKPRDVLHLISRIRLLAMAGYAPRLNGCGMCGQQTQDFYPDSGTTLCTRCASTPGKNGKPYMRIDNKVVRFYTHSIEWPIHIATRLRPHQDTLSALSILLDKHLTYLLSRKLLSSKFLAGVGSNL